MSECEGEAQVSGIVLRIRLWIALGVALGLGHG